MEPSAAITVPPGHPAASAAATAIRRGDVEGLRRVLGEHPWLVAARIGGRRTSRTLLHVATDWPGNFPDVAMSIGVLVEAGADVHARFVGPHDETPLHWAASTDDVEALDALLDAGADIEAPGAVLGGGPPLADARGFKQWRAAFRLLERGAATTLIDAATMGLDERVVELLAGDLDAGELDRAFWSACHGGRLRCAEILLEHGAGLDAVPPWEPLTPLDAAVRDGADELVAWLRARGARTADEVAAREADTGHSQQRDPPITRDR